MTGRLIGLPIGPTTQFHAVVHGKRYRDVPIGGISDVFEVAAHGRQVDVISHDQHTCREARFEGSQDGQA